MQSVGRLARQNIGPSEDAPMSEEIQNRIRSQWGRCAGNAAAAAFPLLFRSGRLVVYTRSAVWATELRHRQQIILTALEPLGVTRVDVRNTPAPLSPHRPTAREVKVSESNRKGISLTAQNVGHSGLKSALERLARRAGGVKDNRSSG